MSEYRRAESNCKVYTSSVEVEKQTHHLKNKYELILKSADANK